MSDDLLVLDNLAVGYGSKVVVDRVNLSMPRGSFVGLLGPNGSGKTTLLKTIVGIIPALGGAVRFQKLNARPPVMGYVPQRETLDPIFPLSGFEVALMGTCGRVAPGRRIGRAERAWTLQCMEQTGVANLAKVKYSELSGGQKQRVLIARALAAKPDLLVLDEPTAGLDPNASQALMELLREINAHQGKAILLVAHDLPVVRRYVQWVIWLHGGRADYGPVSKLLSRERVAEILGLDLP
ncbi:MAG: ABC transporter ATP-binding protein [Verrucomicrobia subdivision 3 bacterium]|nr:ABC transporter ATP-binding protein [Limisphaerales bacterium]